MRFLAENGYVNVDNLESSQLVISVTERLPGPGPDEVDLAVVTMNAAHGRALAAGIVAACEELEAREDDR